MMKEWYPHLLRFVNSAFPNLRRTRLRNLTLLVWAILKRRTLCQAQLARALPGRSKHLHKKKRLHRFAKNQALRPLSLAAQLIPKVCHRFGFHRGKVPISFDWTPLRPRLQEQALFASIPCAGRGLPLLFWATSHAEIRSSTSQNDLEEACLRRVVSALPAEVVPVVLADRGFGRVGFLLFLQGLWRTLGRRVSFVIRLPGKLMVEHQGQRHLLGEWPLEEGELLFLEGAKLRQDRAVTVNLVLYWAEDQEEPWYLATDLEDPQEAVRLYGQRGWIDEMFRDFKQHLGLERSRVTGSARLERLMLGMVLAYLVLALIGLGVEPGFVAEVISWGKGSIIFLGLEYLEQRRGPPKRLLHWKEVR